jgi:predicted ester cyclase
MSMQTNRHIVHRVLEEFWQSYGDNPAVIDELFAADYVNHDLSNPAVRGIEAFKQWAGAIRASWTKGFPDYRIAIEDLVAEDDKVAKRWTFRGTHTGEFMAIAPTGKQVIMRAVTIYCFADDKVQEIWWNYDALGLMQQLGAK